jgi:uncharacterized metal-binding protein
MPETPFQEPHCGSCPVRKASDRLCRKKDGKAPPDCPTAHHEQLTREVFTREYKNDPEALRLAQVAAKVERAGYRDRPAGIGGGLEPVTPRIVEIVGFARNMGYKKLGLIFCFGLRHEAAVVAEILQTNGFDVVSACCKAGNVPKADLGLGPEDQLSPCGPEAMCNPILQAELMNRAKGDFNVMLGLCVGHDTLALKHVEAPVTVLAVKDRLLGNNPLAAVYMYDGYMSYLKKPLF